MFVVSALLSHRAGMVMVAGSTFPSRQADQNSGFFGSLFMAGGEI